MAKRRKRGRSGRPWRETAARLGLNLAEAALWLWLILVWWVHDEAAKDAFRLPKDVVSQALVLASLVFLAFRILELGEVSFRRIWSLPALRASLPLVLAAALSWPVSEHPLHVERALLALAVGAAAFVGWSVGFGQHRLQRLLQGLLIPASALSFFGILQHHDLYRPFDFQGNLEAERLGVTSFAGSAGDLAVFLVLPLLVAQWGLYRCWKDREASPGEAPSQGLKRFGLFAAAFLICLYAVAVTQTLTAVVALGLASVVLWVILLPTRKALAGVAILAVVAGLLVATVGPLRERVSQKASMLARGRVNSVLTGRLDGWKAAMWMVRENPVTGVGHGAYRAEFGDAKLALLDEGSEFLRSQYQVMFANAHSEPLEVVAETGLLGLVALVWALWQIFLALRRRSKSSPEAALAWAGVTALTLLSLGQFPFRLSLTAIPAVLFLAWVFATKNPDSEEPQEEVAASGMGNTLRGPIVAMVLLLVLSLTLQRDLRRLKASRALHQAEIITVGALSVGQVPRVLLQQNIRDLRRASVEDPLEVGIPIALGSQYLLLRSPQAAQEAYRGALALESRPEIYLNIGKAYQMAGDLNEAWKFYDQAVRLDHHMESQIPIQARRVEEPEAAAP